MNNKNIFVTILILIVVVGVGFLFFGKNTTENPPVNDADQGAQGKIDINAVCEGALAYKTFPDGASADLFVAECKEGKHPDVIEEFKKQQNLGDEATI